MSRTRTVLWGLAILLGLVIVAGRPSNRWLLFRLTSPAPDEQQALTQQLAHNAPTPVPDTTPEPLRPEAWTPPRHVVFVVGCTVRKDQMGLYGGPPDTTPFLDALGARGVVFDDVIASTPWTRPAVASLLTGRHGLSLGLVDPGPGRNDRKLSMQATTLAERLQRAGWLTLGASANPNITATFQFDQGFDGYQFGLGAAWKDKLSGQTLVSTLLEALDERRDAGDDRPFYLQAVLIDPHAKRRAPDDEVAPFLDPDIPPPVARYRAHLRRMDDAVRALHEGLTNRGLLDETLLVFVGDHGEGLRWPAHHGHAHGLFFGSSTTHVPWILAGPGLPEGRRVLGVASQVDVLPTLLQLLDLPAAARAEGVDLFPTLMTPAAATPDRPVFSDTWFSSGNRVASFTRTRTCQLDLSPTLSIPAALGTSFRDGCTDRHQDPLAFHPSDPPDPWRETLTGWRDDQTRRAAGMATDEAQVGDDLAAHLAALGYVDEGDSPPVDSD